MAKYSPVCNIHLLKSLCDAGYDDGYWLVLAHDVVKEAKLYEDFFKNRSGIVILDNSLIELGGAVDAPMMLEAAEIVSPSYIVLPDVLMDTPASVKAVKSALEDPAWQELAEFCSRGFLAVIQGKTHYEMQFCTEAYWRHDKERSIKAWGIPRAYANINGSRREVVGWLNGHSTYKKPIHLMGFSDHIDDDLLCASRMADVMGIDSATPLRLGWEHKRLDLSKPSIELAPTKSREAFFLASLESNPQMIYNVGYVKGILAHGEYL